MTTKDMLQILINKYDSLQKGQDSLQKGQDSLQKGQDSLQKGQDGLKQEIAVLREEMKKGFKEVHTRLDKQGKQLAYLDDDAPTREEHDALVKRVEKVEKHFPRN